MRTNEAPKDQEEEILGSDSLGPEDGDFEESTPPPRKKSWLRRLLWVFTIGILVFVLLIAAGGLALKYFFPPEKIRPLVEAELSKALNMPGTIESVDLSLLSGLDVRGVAIGKDPSLFRLGALVLEYDLTELLQGRLIIHKVLIDAPDIYLESTNGVWNFQPILDKQKKRTGKTETGRTGRKSFCRLSGWTCRSF